MFCGPPGTGKTACAEALASRLGKRIIVVNYADMQSKWVGETEANIVNIFREAADADAVLFWDEADAMFYDRDLALRTWEIRDLNVLLQAVERFEGVCILSTNRKVTLDAALERRIAIKIEFERPDKEQRFHIWKKLIPSAIPLADDVSIERLSLEDLSGGEIKNVLLNAARLSLCRTSNGPLTIQDFAKAIKMEKNGSWTRTKQFGFGRKE